MLGGSPTKGPDMTADASFRTRREALGLSAQWVAENLPNRNGTPTAIRTIQYWDAGGFPPDRADELDALLDRFEDWISDELDQLESAIEGLTSDDELTTIIYLPRPRDEAALSALYGGQPPVPVETYWRFLALIEQNITWSGGIFGFLWVDKTEAAGWLLGERELLIDEISGDISGFYVDGGITLVV